MIYVIEHDVIPPSANHGVSGQGARGKTLRIKQEWEGIFGFLLMKAQVPRKLERAALTAELEFRTKGRRDVDNFTFAISKPFGDVMAKGGWLLDDDYSRFSMAPVTIKVGVPMDTKGRMKLTLDTTTA